MSFLAASSGSSLPRPNFATRFTTNMRDVVTGFLPGMFEIGKATVGDVGRGVAEIGTLGQVDTEFKTPQLAKAMGKGFWDESFLPALFTGHPVEAYQRFSERPFEGMLDLGALAFGGYGATARAGRAGAKAGIFKPDAARIGGHKPITEIVKSEPVGTGTTEAARLSRRWGEGEIDFESVKPFQSGDIKYGQADVIDGDLWFRPVGRAIYESGKDKPKIETAPHFMNRSGNELAARIGDRIEALRQEHLADVSFIGNNARIKRRAVVDQAKLLFFGRDDWTIEHAQAKKNYHDAMFGKTTMLGGKEAGLLEELGIDPLDATPEMMEELAVAKMKGYTPDEFMAWVRNEDLEGNPILSKEQIGANIDSTSTIRDRIVREIGDVSGEIAIRSDELAADTTGLSRFADMSDKDLRRNLYALQLRFDELDTEIKTYRKHLENDKRWTDDGRYVQTAQQNARSERWARLFNREKYGDEAMDRLWSNEHLDNLYESMRRIDDETRTLFNENNYTDSFEWMRDEIAELNRHRDNRWVFGRDKSIINTEVTSELLRSTARIPKERRSRAYVDVAGEKHAPLFFSHKPHSGEQKHKRVGDEKAKLTMSPQEPGNPLELFLEGRERMDLDVYLDEFHRQHRDWAQASFISNFFADAPKYEFDELKNLEDFDDITFSDPKTGKRDTEAPWVAVADDDILLERVVEIDQFIDEAATAAVENAPPNKKRQVAMDVAQLRAVAPLITGDAKFIKLVNDPALQGMTHKQKLAYLEGTDINNYKTKYRVISREVYEALQEEAFKSSEFIKRWYDFPLEIWKNLVLHLRPKWMVNNAVGSFLLLAMSEGFFDATRLMWKVSKTRNKVGKKIYGDEKFTNRLRDEGLIVPGRNGEDLHIREAIEQNIPQVSGGSGSAHLYRNESLKRYNPDTKLGRVNLARATMMNKIADFNQKWADDPARLAKAFGIMEREAKRFEDMLVAKGGQRLDDGSIWFDEEVTGSLPRIAREVGIDGRITRDIIYDIMLNPRNKDSTQIRNQIIDETLRDMIDFQDLTPREREVIRRVFPFWSWIKGSSKVGARATYEHPLRVYAIGQTGELGLQAQEEQFGELPSFLKGAAILPDFLQNEQGTRTLNTGAMNPWLTPVDAATLVASMVPFGTQRLPFGSENPVAMASPFVKAPIEAFTGRDVFFGTPIDQRSNLFMTMAQRATSTPLTNLLGHPLKIGQQVQPGQPPAWMGKLYRPQSPRATTVASPWAELTGYVFPKPSELRMGPVRARAVEERRQELGL